MSGNTIRLGYVGLGNIGGPMATSLAKWEGAMTVFDLSEKAVATLVDAGAAAADSLADLGARADIIGICVLNDAQVVQVVSGEGGLLSTAAPGTIIAIHSTISPRTAIDLAAEAAEKGVVVLDAPISGGAVAAQSGRLAVMVGGPREAYTRLKEPYKLTAEMLIHAGDEVGAGTRMKLARNLLHFIAFTATAEASRLAEAAGIDIAKLGKVVRHTDAITGGAGSIMLRETTAPIESDDFWYGIFAPVRTLGEKDLSLALDLGRELGVDLPLGEIALRDFAAAIGVPHIEGESA
ncbi:NAD-binding protein [Gordonia pseudamarae]|jgi:3-hydroxyisobutyrate dehydrogenase|uniref:NAD-binding protein n=1 Tax=Gordonia pseudamarae TaxID=2831662 RepID=A0ABX6IKH9_9ACTN|nr:MULTISPECIES: NAD(P)-dependent oxidoreductase [Gordonia]MBD0021165.1 NAD(P)-dependent oxidoreductase [Gordonia sp. (in: high G+C Gram-positive bacteria)]QHN27535.1 NAD-binding protein [Gordonia pseudamarae]QHN36417.1 NAD-binding protein [Gordonia pseudamarae]